MEKIRVAVMTHTIDGRKAMGTAIVARKCVEALLARRDEFDVTLVHYEPCDDPIYTHGAREILIPKFRWNVLNRRSLRTIYFFFTCKDRFDIFHWYQPRLYPFFWFAPATHLVVTVHSVDTARSERFNLANFFYFWTLRLFRRHVAAALATSTRAKKEIEQAYKFTGAQVRIVHIAVDDMYKPASIDEIKRVKQKYELPETFFLNVARLIPSKNVLRTIRAYSKFYEHNPTTDIRYVQVGRKGTEQEVINAFVGQSPAKDHIQFTGYIETEDLPALYSAAVALTFPMLNDGLGLPVLEAMASGTPTVISDTAQPEITHDDAMLVNALDESTITAAMQQIADDPALREKLKKNGLAKAAQFRWDVSTGKVIDIYRGLIHS